MVGSSPRVYQTAAEKALRPPGLHSGQQEVAAALHSLCIAHGSFAPGPASASQQLACRCSIPIVIDTFDTAGVQVVALMLTACCCCCYCCHGFLLQPLHSKCDMDVPCFATELEQDIARLEAEADR